MVRTIIEGPGSRPIVGDKYLDFCICKSLRENDFAELMACMGAEQIDYEKVRTANIVEGMTPEKPLYIVRQKYKIGDVRISYSSLISGEYTENTQKVWNVKVEVDGEESDIERILKTQIETGLYYPEFANFPEFKEIEKKEDYVLSGTA